VLADRGGRGAKRMNDDPQPISIKAEDTIRVSTIEKAEVLTYPQALLQVISKPAGWSIITP
jgi:hypothetical protein